MAGWGISPKASAKEKIKAEYADTLHGYNSCGVIDYNHYSELFDFGMELLDRMYELGKAEPKQGKWIPFKLDTRGYIEIIHYECSNCHNVRGGRTMYCPNCGAKMVKGTEE